MSIDSRGLITVREKRVLPPRPRSKLQRQQFRKFRRASLFATKAMNSAELRDFYQWAARRKNISARNLAVQDYFRPPVIEAIRAHNYDGRPGGRVFIEVDDSAPPASARVSIRTLKGKLIETGKAVVDGMLCSFVARKKTRRGKPVQIEAVVTDHAGNRASSSVTHYLPLKWRRGQPKLSAPPAVPAVIACPQPPSAASSLLQRSTGPSSFPLPKPDSAAQRRSPIASLAAAEPAAAPRNSSADLQS